MIHRREDQVPVEDLQQELLAVAAMIRQEEVTVERAVALAENHLPHQSARSVEETISLKIALLAAYLIQGRAHKMATEEATKDHLVPIAGGTTQDATAHNGDATLTTVHLALTAREIMRASTVRNSDADVDEAIVTTTTTAMS